MKSMTRLIACVLVLATLIAMLPVTASATTINCGSGGSQWERTYSLYHTWGLNTITIQRMSKGTAVDVLGDSYSCYGKYTYKVYDPDGDLIKSGTWRPDKNNAAGKSTTLVGRWAATGTYKIVIGRVKFDTTYFPSLDEANGKWTTYPRYKFVY